MEDAMAIAERLNGAEAREVLTNCCAATAWIEGMLQRRPYADDEAILTAAAEVWSRLGESDWLEAFAAHPMIGDVETLRKKYAAAKELAADEQSGVAGADEATLAELAQRNREYLERFGFIFIVLASGKSAAQILALLQERINNSRDVELENAAAEQLKITQMRLRKLATRAGDS